MRRSPIEQGRLLVAGAAAIFTRFSLAMAAVIFLLTGNSAWAGTWTPLAHTAPSTVGHMILLSDGTVMAENNNDGGTYGPIWYRLTPDATGSYVNGTWTTLASMINTRLFFASQLLQNGQLFVAGGEYGTGGAAGEVYDPIANVWTAAPTPGHTFSDADSAMLPNGNVIVALVEGTLRNTLIYNTASNTWSTGPTCNGIHNESAWVKLPDGSILFVDRETTNSERYIPAQNAWITDATVPVSLYDPYGDETGPGMLLPNGKVIFFGATGHTAIYTPSGTTANGTWIAGPDFPNGQGMPDAPSAIMPNGNILCATSPIPISGNVFQSPTSFYEYNYVTNSFTQVNAPAGGTTESGSCFQRDMLLLPDGTILSSRFSSQLYVYNGGGTPLAAGKPAINSISQNSDGSFHLVGTLLNGISEGACYGDDNQDSTNRPLVKLTSGSNVYFARTYNWSSTGVATGSTPLTTEFTVPTSVPAGNYSISVVANGFSSDPMPFVPTTSFAVTAAMNASRTSPTTVLLNNGKVLVAGGNVSGTATATAELYDPTTGTWTATGSLHTARYTATGTLLPNGKVLVAGGFGTAALASAEIYDPATGTWTVTGSLNAAREAPFAVLLPNGQVLAAGGITPSVLATAELYNPATGVWTTINPMNAARSFATATLLPNGTVLVAAGRSNSALLNTSEIYDPVAGTWTLTSGKLNAGRYYHTATLLPNGKVLVAGGYNGGTILSSAEIFDPTAGTWTTTGALNVARDFHSASLLPNGKVFVACGVGATVELYDPTAGTWSPVGSFSVTHTQQTATVMANGKVLVAGGGGTVAETYDSAAGSWSTTGPLIGAREFHVSQLLPNGKVLAAGGYSTTYLGSAELYDPVSASWGNAGNMSTPRSYSAAVLLPNGKFMVAGGENGSGYTPAVDFYDPNSGNWSSNGGLNTLRSRATATLLANGKVLVAGGNSTSGAIGSAELYDPVAATWTFTGSLTTPRCSQGAALLNTGKVLVMGGVNAGQSIPNAELYDPVSGNWTATGSLSHPRSSNAVVLLPNGKVLVAGGTGSITYDNTAEIYDPVAGAWSATGNLSVGRNSPAATLLPNGKVLLTGGLGASGDLVSSELYDPANGVWSMTGSLTNARQSGVATLLPNGKILVEGGYNGSSVISTAEVYDPGLGFAVNVQPQLTSVSSSLSAGGNLSVGGSGFRGISSASGGTYGDSSSNYPVVQLQALNGGPTAFLLSNPATNWSDTSFTSAAVSGFPFGYALVTVFTNGIPSSSAFVDIVPSSNATLSNLVLSSGTLTPTFTSLTTGYTDNVSDTTGSITLTPTVADPTASVTVNGISVTSGTASGAINLSTGPNTINTIVTAQDGVTTDSYSVVVTRLTNLQNWRLTYFGSPANSGNGADTFDYDATGLPNLAKYAFGLNPTVPAAYQIPQAVLSGNAFGISFSQPAGVSGITYSAQWTGSLSPANWQPVPDTGSGGMHVFSISIGSSPSLFMRLQVSEP